MIKTELGIHPRVGGLLQGVIPYVRSRCPKIVRNPIDARAGSNCVGVLHLAIGTENLPPHLHCDELYRDTTFLETIGGFAGSPVGELALEALDIFHFGWADLKHPLICRPKVSIADFKPRHNASGFLVNADESPLTHVAVFSGARTAQGDPLMYHGSQEAGQALLEPLSVITQNARYAQIYRISRFVGTPALVTM